MALVVCDAAATDCTNQPVLVVCGEALALCGVEWERALNVMTRCPFPVVSTVMKRNEKPETENTHPIKLAKRNVQFTLQA